MSNSIYKTRDTISCVKIHPSGFMIIGMTNGTIVFPQNQKKNFKLWESQKVKVESNRLLDIEFSYDMYLYVSTMDSTSVSISKINLDTLNIKQILQIPLVNGINNVCAKLCSLGGQIKDEIYVAFGDNRLGQEKIQQSDHYFGKIICIQDDQGREPQIICRGIRNPQSISTYGNTFEMVVADSFYDDIKKIDTVRYQSNLGWNVPSGHVNCSEVSNITDPNLFPIPHYTFKNNIQKWYGCVLANKYYFVGEIKNSITVLDCSKTYLNSVWDFVGSVKIPYTSPPLVGLTTDNHNLFGYTTNSVFQIK